MPAYRTEAPRQALTKILATVGPASDSPEMIAKLISAGVDCFRLNFSHGSTDDHAKRLNTIREVSARLGVEVGVLGDLPGPKIRIGQVPPHDGHKGIMLVKGQTVVFSRDATEAHLRPAEGDSIPEAVFPTTYPEMINEVHAGQRVLINDGAIRTLAIQENADTPDDELHCTVTVPGLVTTGKGINLPETDVSAPAISDRDWELAKWGITHGVDFLAMSFVRHESEITSFRERLATLAPQAHDDGVESESGGTTSSRIPLVAKIEKPQAVAHIDAIVEAADLIMVARGDLGVEMDIAQVPIVQKQIVSVCHEWGTPVIVATQMLETMVESATPTRAEATDVAGAVLDGADAVMLSAETAVGHHPDLVVSMMSRIIDAAENSLEDSAPRARAPRKFREERNPTAALAHGAWHVAHDTGADLIICWSERGGTAQFLSRNNFHRPIVSYTSDRLFARRKALLRGVRPITTTPPQTLVDWYTAVDQDLLDIGMAERGHTAIMVAGRPLGRSRRTNTITLHSIGLPYGAFTDADL